jgi:hypothetical protein
MISIPTYRRSSLIYSKQFDSDSQHGVLTSFDHTAPADKSAPILDDRTQISRFRDDCEKLDREQRLHDSAALKKVSTWRDLKANTSPGALHS